MNASEYFRSLYMFSDESSFFLGGCGYTFYTSFPTKAGCFNFNLHPYQSQQEVLVIPGGVTNNVAGDRGLEPDLVFLFDLVHADLGP